MPPAGPRDNQLEKGAYVALALAKDFDSPRGEVEYRGRLHPDRTRIDNCIDKAPYTCLDFHRVRHRAIVAGQEQGRTHDWFAKCIEHRTNDGMVRDTNSNCAPFRVLQPLRNFSRCRQYECVGTWRERLDKPVSPVVDPCISPDFRQVTANQREIMVLVSTTYPVNPRHRPGIAKMAAECVARIRRVCNQPTTMDNLDDPGDAPRLRVCRMNFDEPGHASNCRGASDQRLVPVRNAQNCIQHSRRLSRQIGLLSATPY